HHALLGHEARALVTHLLDGLRRLAVYLPGPPAARPHDFPGLAAGVPEHLAGLDRAALAEEEPQAPVLQPVLQAGPLVLLAVGGGDTVAGAIGALGQPDSPRLLAEVPLRGALTDRQLRVDGGVARHQGQVRVGSGRRERLDHPRVLQAAEPPYD